MTTWETAVADPVQLNGHKPSDELHFTDYGNGRRFLAEADGNAIWNDVWGCWHLWDGTRFARDQERGVELIAYQTTRRMYDGAYGLPTDKERIELSTWAIRSESRRAIAAMLESAKPFASIQPNGFDRDADLFNVLNGTIHLPTRTLRPHSKDDRLSKRAGVEYDPAAGCPMFDKVLHRVFEGNAELIAYIWRVIGYALTGRLSVHALFICYGTGRNGKSTLLYAIRRLLGDYAVHVKAEVFTADARTDPQGFSLVNLAGARVVTAVETGAGRRLNETLVKEATGGDPITAAPKYGREFTFYPVYKPFIATNHRPAIRGADEGIWSRPRLIEFKVRIPDAEQIPDHEMKARIDSELPGILNRALAGLAEFDRIGLADPAIVKAATEAYRQDSDVLGEWIDARCETGEGHEAAIGELHRSYATFTGAGAMSKRALGDALEERGFKRHRTEKARVHLGIRVRPHDANDGSPDTTMTHQSGFQEVVTRAREGDFSEASVSMRHPSSLTVEVLPPATAGHRCPRHEFAEVFRPRPELPWRCRACGTEAVPS